LNAASTQGEERKRRGVVVHGGGAGKGRRKVGKKDFIFVTPNSRDKEDSS
tara:strand:+ start:418 stop:567 length:150 start_codon:yes stop_codon:yes gene_type:complete